MQTEPNILPTINRFKPGSLGEEITSPSSSLANLTLWGRPDKEEENGSWLLFP